jgi:hypothetical protein
MANKTTRSTGAAKNPYGVSPLGKVEYAIGRFLKRSILGTFTGLKTGATGVVNIPTQTYNVTHPIVTSGHLTPVPLQIRQEKPSSSRNGSGGAGGAGGSGGTLPVRATPSNVKFNLPPHQWSIPVNQRVLNNHNNEVADYFAGFEHGLRRAVMWCYGYGAIDNNSYTWQGSPLSSASSPAATGATSPLDTNWGFQFLWNPESIGNALSRNANFTPTAVDKLANLFGLFTAMEAVSFKIVIDRVNDFACIKSNTDYQTIATYYSANGYPSNPEDTVEQLKNLSKLGTMSDIEYIYKMINGEGTNGSVWKNALGRQTADLGFLAPTAVAIQFGPNPDSLSYVGYVDGITITHNMFTEDMIPIHSEVNVNFVAFARTSLSQK